MNENDLLKLSEYFDEGISLSDFTLEELEEMTKDFVLSKDKFKQKYFDYYDDVKHSSLKKQDWWVKGEKQMKSKTFLTKNKQENTPLILWQDKEKYIPNIINFVASELSQDKSGHGVQHAIRVFSNAKKIIKKEGGNEKIVLTSALIHDTVDKKLFSDINARLEVVKNFLRSNNYLNNEIDEILYIITNISWNNGENKHLDSLNAQIVRDADRLDAIGAIGIIRTIEYGNSKNRNFYDEENIKQINQSYTFNKLSNTTLSHFYEKLLLLKDLMHTNTAKKLAEKRHEFMVQFLQEFYCEI